MAIRAHVKKHMYSFTVANLWWINWCLEQYSYFIHLVITYENVVHKFETMSKNLHLERYIHIRRERKGRRKLILAEVGKDKLPNSLTVLQLMQFGTLKRCRFIPLWCRMDDLAPACLHAWSKKGEKKKKTEDMSHGHTWSWIRRETACTSRSLRTTAKARCSLTLCMTTTLNAAPARTSSSSSAHGSLWPAAAIP